MPRHRWPLVLRLRRYATYERGARNAGTTTTVEWQDNRVDTCTESPRVPCHPSSIGNISGHQAKR
jgi:hypothetical protein